ncbi:MAG: endonuclease [Minwuia thermotolerans]|nr:MAG: endonuclease [Minwuia thermotolerans]
MTRFLTIVAVLGLFAPTALTADGLVLQLDYPGFTVWHDCELGGPLATFYAPGPDTGDVDREHHFHLDPDLPEGCRQQTSTDPYPSPDYAFSYDRGHLVPANHLDGDAEAIAASNVMTNITPQQSSFNRTGAWRETERRIECWREDRNIGIWIGVLWGDNQSNDHVVHSHGIPTPDTFVKLVVGLDTGVAIAWKLENTRLRAGELDGLTIPPRLAAELLGPLIGTHQVIGTLPATSDPDDWPKLRCDQG